MRKIFGRVLAKETNTGIPNLVVAAYDSERVVDAQRHDVACVDVERLGRRLGSTLTGADGSFVFEPGCCDLAGGGSRPDLTVAVFAPEDALGVERPQSLPAARRLLHVSTIPRTDAAVVEAYVIRLLQAQLDFFGISTDVERAGHRPPSPALTRVVHSLEQAWSVRDSVRERLAPHMRRRLEQQQQHRTIAREKLSRFSTVPHALRDHPLFAAKPDDAAAASARAVEAGVARVRSAEVQVTLGLSAADAERLGVALAHGQPHGDVDTRAVLALMENRTGGTDLVRRRTLLDACAGHPATDEGAPAVPTAPASPTTPLALPENIGDAVRQRVIGQLQELPLEDGTLPKRPDRANIEAELRRELRAGPADVTAYHDFHSLQIAFKHVWTQVFDGSLKTKAEDLYEELVRIYDDAGVEMPPFDAIQDIAQLHEFIAGVKRTVTPCGTIGMDEYVMRAFPFIEPAWGHLSAEQKAVVTEKAHIVLSNSPPEEKAEARRAVELLLAAEGGRLGRLIYELGRALAEPYAFDVFAPDTCNFGVLLTYRQKWEPLTYQAGELVATVPLAPGESRKYSKRRHVKKSRAEKQIERSSSSHSLQTSEVTRAEADILKKVQSATNFKMTANGSFNIGIGSMEASSEFGGQQSLESANTKKDFHEATLKAAQEYKRERSMEIETSGVDETEATESGEISNPNNELTVTYLFYELQRRYRISEHLHRARAVVLVAQDVPAPHEITEAWLVRHQWILARVLLDDSFRPALDYLTSGMAGDEVGVEVIKARWQTQKALVEKLEGDVTKLMGQRDKLRELLVNLTQTKAEAQAASFGTIYDILTLGAPDPNEKRAEWLEAARGAAEARLRYAEDAAADAQRKLTAATDAFESATREYAAASQNQFARHIAIDQLRVHVKENILYYMQAIWAHEPSDQRFFRLYRKKVTVPEPGTGYTVTKVNTAGPSLGAPIGGAAMQMQVKFQIGWGPIIQTKEVDLVEIADLDNPLGYKGNYIMFPLKKPTFLTDVMLGSYVDEYLGVRDPDEFGNMSIEELEKYVLCVERREDVSPEEKARVREIYVKRLTEDRRASDEIVVPTGQLFIEALPGAHPLLEDFKLEHRRQDMLKIRAEVRHAELENLRRAARIGANQLADPDIEKAVVVDDKVGALVGDT
ncbi:hypothetical protein WMF30_36940 [Sorangium sp. So ce134]